MAYYHVSVCMNHKIIRSQSSVVNSPLLPLDLPPSLEIVLRHFLHLLWRRVVTRPRSPFEAAFVGQPERNGAKSEGSPLSVDGVLDDLFAGLLTSKPEGIAFRVCLFLW